MGPDDTMIPVVLFTHPTCVGCTEAIRRMQAFSDDHADVDFRITSLAGQEGKTLAEQWGVKSVPTVVFNDNPQLMIVGVPKKSTLDTAYLSARGQ